MNQKYTKLKHIYRNFIVEVLSFSAAKLTSRATYQCASNSRDRPIECDTLWLPLLTSAALAFRKEELSDSGRQMDTAYYYQATGLFLLYKTWACHPIHAPCLHAKSIKIVTVNYTQLDSERITEWCINIFSFSTSISSGSCIFLLCWISTYCHEINTLFGSVSVCMSCTNAKHKKRRKQRITYVWTPCRSFLAVTHNCCVHSRYTSCK